jgi:hypothetical protein
MRMAVDRIAAPGRANIAARLGAIILVVLGVLFVVTSLLGFLPEDRRMTVTGLLLFATLGVVLGVAGVTWLRRLSAQESSDRARTEEQAVLEMVTKSRGELTAAEVSRRLRLPPAAAEAILGRLTEQRMIEPDLDAEGAVVYRPKQ